MLEEWEHRQVSQIGPQTVGQASTSADVSSLLEELKSGLSRSGVLNPEPQDELDGESRLFKWLSFESVDSERQKKSRDEDEKDLGKLLRKFSERTGTETEQSLARAFAVSGGDTAAGGSEVLTERSDFWESERRRKSNLLANQSSGFNKLAPLPANRPSSSRIRTPVGEFDLSMFPGRSSN